VFWIQQQVRHSNFLKEVSMKKSFVGLAITVLTGMAISSAQSNLTFSGTVYAAPNSSLQNTTVIACLWVNETCDEQRSRAQQLNANGSSVRFQIPDLENSDYLLLAWRDLNGNNEADSGDEVGLYQRAGRVSLLRPPADNLELRLKRFTGDLDTLLEEATEGNTSSVTPSQANASNTTSLQFAPSSVWQNMGGGSYEASFGKDNPNQPKGNIYLEILPSRTKTGSLLEQTRSIWQTETKGGFDEKGKLGGVYVRLLPSGLNVSVTTGTLRRQDNPNPESQLTIQGIYSVLFVVEQGNQVTPFFFLMTRLHERYSYYTQETEGRGLMLEFMNSIRTDPNLRPAALYTEANLLGKWKSTSGSSLFSNWYSANTGAYVTSTFNSSSFGMWTSFSAGGTGTYNATHITSNNSGTSTQKQKSTTRWRINGDVLEIEMLEQRYTSYYQLYGISRDDRGQPVILAKYLNNSNAPTRDDLDGSPDELWVMDN
jgi:uncharacterized protein (DUF2141 family)